MKDYSNFEIKDFLADEAFCRWVTRGHPQDTRFWESWIRKNPDRAAVALAAKALVSDIAQAQEYLPEEELQQELQRLSEARKVTPDTELPYVAPRKSWARYWPAALLAVTCGLVFFYFYSNPSPGTPDPYEALQAEAPAPLIEITNREQKQRVVTMEDGSRIRLFPNSKISYSRTFSGKEREVFLTGEAFFEVTRNPERPFRVYTRDLVTTVLGTSFRVRAFDSDKDVRVVVKTGKVRVAGAGQKAQTLSGPEPEEVVLLPNQQVVYNREERRMLRSLVDNPVQIGPETVTRRPLLFERAPVSAVFDTLQKRYGLQIIYDAELLAACQLTAELGQEPLFEKLSLICKAIQARYELVDGQVVIYGTSCR